MHTALATIGPGLSTNPAAFRDASARPAPGHAPAVFGATRRLKKDEELFAEGDRAGFFYKVTSGAVRTYKLLEDGRRQIDAFHLAGDIFGIESGPVHRFTAEAVGEATIVAYRRCSLETLATSDGELARQIVAATMRSLERAQDHMILLGRKSALEKIATFILDMSARVCGKEAVSLPMSRADIADHLGLTIETVSRSLTELERRGAIAVPAQRRTILLRDRSALRRLDA